MYDDFDVWKYNVGIEVRYTWHKCTRILYWCYYVWDIWAQQSEKKICY